MIMRKSNKLLYKKKSKKSKKPKKKKKIKKQLLNKKTNELAGKVIGAGGFGCVFNPPLKCKNKTTKHKIKYISKLMQKNIGKQEYDEMLKYSKQLKKIPNFKEYFLIDNVYLCNPDKLSQSDLQGFDRSCSETSIFKNKTITSNNINKSLSELISLNIPHGGINLTGFLKNLANNLYLNNLKINQEFIKINNSLIKLLKNGIIPMNKKKILHLDIKPDNILLDTYSYKTKLIDWGLSSIIDSKTLTTNSMVMKQSLLYNKPFSCILFTSDINNIIKDYCKRYNNNIDIIGKQSLIDLSRYIFKRFLEKHSSGHLPIVIEFIEDLLKVENFKWKPYDIDIDDKCETSSELILHLFLNNIAMILDKYLEKQNNNKICKLNLHKYFNEVYKHNVDIYGFLTTYLEILINYNKDISHNNININLFIVKLTDILFKYCYSTTYATEPIPVNSLITELESLNTIILKRFSKHSSKLSSTRSSKHSSTRSSKHSSTRSSKRSL